MFICHPLSYKDFSGCFTSFITSEQFLSLIAGGGVKTVSVAETQLYCLTSNLLSKVWSYCVFYKHFVSAIFYCPGTKLKKWNKNWWQNLFVIYILFCSYVVPCLYYCTYRIQFDGKVLKQVTLSMAGLSGPQDYISHP